MSAEAGDYGKREMAAANGGAVLFSVVACRAELSQHRATLSPDSLEVGYGAQRM